MKRIVALFLVLLLMRPAAAMAAKNGYGWTDGAYVLGNTGYKVVLPDHLNPVEPYPNELATASTKSYSKSGDKGIVIFFIEATPFDMVNAYFQKWQTVEDSKFTVEKRFIANASETALDDWIATLGSKTISEYIEASGLTLNGQAIPYALSINNHLGNHALQASFVFALPDSNHCYTIFVSELFDAGKKPKKENIEQFRNELMNGVGSLLKSSITITR